MTNRPPPVEAQLADALHALADNVQATPQAYSTVSRQWRRRERHRQLVLATLITVVFTLTVVIGLWALNNAATSWPTIVL
jgi:hypothetical protein